jgi:hypothetical protein
LCEISFPVAHFVPYYDETGPVVFMKEPAKKGMVL